MSIITNHATNEITLGTTTLAVDNNGVLVGTDQASNPINLSGIPVGTIVEAPSAPTDGVWLECDGSSYPRSAYADLEGPLPDGVTWTKHAPPAGWVGETQQATITNSGAYLLNDYVGNQTWRTTDFVNFTVVLNKRLFVGYLNTTLVGVSGQDIYTSTDDGITWNTINIQTSNPGLTGLASSYLIRGSYRGNTELLLVPNPPSDHFLATSDGTTFTKHTISGASGVYMVQKIPQSASYFASSQVIAPAAAISSEAVTSYISAANNKDVWYTLLETQHGGVMPLVDSSGQVQRVFMCPGKVFTYASTIPFNRCGNDTVMYVNAYTSVMGNKFRANVALYSTGYTTTTSVGVYDVGNDENHPGILTFTYHKAPTALSSLTGFNYAYLASLSSNATTTILALDKYDGGWVRLDPEFWIIEEDASKFAVPYVESNNAANKSYIKASN